MILRAVVPPAEKGNRLDEVLPKLFPDLSRGKLRKIIDWGGCTLNSELVRVVSRGVKGGERVEIGVMEPEKYVELRLQPEEILYEDDHFLVVNKASGINSQRTPYQLKGTLEHAVALHFRDIGVTEPVRVVHRLDRGTSGVMVFPKLRSAAAWFSTLLQRGEVEKKYVAVSSGDPDEDTWEVDVPLGRTAYSKYGVTYPGKPSKSLFSVAARGKDSFLADCTPVTGRTHQLRIHLSHCGHPIYGDAMYGGRPAARLMLHCRRMAFRAGDKLIEAEAPWDAAFQKELDLLSITP